MIEAPLGIAGLGLIGGSIALRARSSGTRLIAYDRDAATIAAALERGIIDEAATDLDALFGSVRTLAIALPVDATIAALRRLAGRRGPALVFDVASVKEPLVTSAAQVPNFVGTHPMAGRERGGLDAADAGLFEHASWAHTPCADPALAERMRRFIRAMGAVPLEIDAGEHDRIVALTSHLPQALSVILGTALAAAANTDRHVMELCGPGMMSMLRLARSPAATWLPIVRANAVSLAQRLHSFAQAIETVAAALEAGDSAPLMSYFESGQSAAEILDQRFMLRARASIQSASPSSPNSAPPPAR